MLFDLLFFLLEERDHCLGTDSPNWGLFRMKMFPPAVTPEEDVSFPVLKVLHPQMLKMMTNRIAAPDAAPMMIQF